MSKGKSPGIKEVQSQNLVGGPHDVATAVATAGALYSTFQQLSYFYL